MCSHTVALPIRAWTLALGIAIGLVASNSAEATVLSGQIEGSCQIVSPEECKIAFFSDIRHDPATPVVAHRVLANGRVIYDGKNDASNPVSHIPGRFLRGFTGDIAARCGRRYTLELLAMASDDTGLRSLTKTGPFRCPSRVP